MVNKTVQKDLKKNYDNLNVSFALMDLAAIIERKSDAQPYIKDMVDKMVL